MSKMKSDLSGFERYTSQNWDGDGAQAVSLETLDLARKIVSAIRNEIGLPDASPSVAGALGLVWNVDDNYIYVSIRNQLTAMFYRRGPQGLTEDRLVEAYSSFDLFIELTGKLLSVKTTGVLENPQIDLTRNFIAVEPPNIEIPEPVVPSGPDEWATKPIVETIKYKVA